MAGYSNIKYLTGFLQEQSQIYLFYLAALLHLLHGAELYLVLIWHNHESDSLLF